MSHSTSVHTHLIHSAAYGAVGISILLIIGKGYVWQQTGSVSVQASLIDSLLDAFASLLNFFAIRHALLPPDKEHRFGHGKIEALAGLGQSVIIGISAFWILIGAWHSHAHVPKDLLKNSLFLGFLIFSLVLTSGLVVWQRYVIRQTQSLAISADSLHYQGDLLANGGMFIGFSSLYYPSLGFLDRLIGVGIALYIFKTSWGIGKKAFDVLMDRELPDEVVGEIKKIVSSHPQILGFHDLRTRNAGYKDFIQLHLDLDPHLSLRDAHEISHEIITLIQKEFPRAEVIIHEDPSPC